MTTALLALVVATAPPAARDYTLEPAKSVVRYHIVHKFHDVTGASSTAEGKAALQPDGKVLAMVRVPMRSFDSGERNRDADMLGVVEADRFPFVVFKGIAQLDGRALDPAKQGTTVKAR
ncbi:MAG TPA: YceI family protein, partial [Anaeromyxobacteraceae bacterium]|nr:YceI family protein [Anaeromyxobacteraceae bacterium]